MADLNKLIEMLNSPDANTRYDACQGLRVADESSEAAVLALEKATQDNDSGVAERARAALQSDVHQMMLRKMRRAEMTADDRLAQAAESHRSRGKVYNTQQEKQIDFAIGSIGWFVIMSVIWLLIILSQGTGEFVVLCTMPILLLANIVLLIVLAFTRRWMALGMLSMLTANLLVGLLFRPGSSSLCAVPFIIDYYPGFW
jgi:hypothetical protein